MTTTVTAKIQVRKGTAAQWTSANPTLLSGEIGFETDTIKLKIGDGTTAWTALAYHHDPDLAATYAAIAHTHSGVYEPANANLQSHLSSTANPHSVTAAQVGADATGTAAGLIATHEAALDPHPGYLTPAEGDAAYSAIGHNHSGTYEPAGTMTTHEAAVDPHPGYALESSLGGAALLSVGTTTGTVAAGDDARFSTGTTGDAFASSHPGGNQHIDWTADQGATNLHAGNIPDLSGTYAVTAKGVTNGDSHDHSGGDGAQIAYSTLSGLPTLGTAAATAATDYAAASHAHAASAITSGTIDTARLGSGTANSSTYLRGDQTWAAASGGVAADTHAATEKTTPVDADELPLADSAASWALKKLSWVNLKTTLSGVFALLAGKSGGQTLIGGTGVTDKLTLQGTSGNGTVTSTALEFKVGNNGSTNALTILNDGKIGINKTEPIYQFVVNRGATAGIVSAFESSGVYAAVQIISTGGTVNLVGSGSSLAIQCAGTEVMRLSHVNNSVGIGISTPSAKLHSLATTEQLRLGYDASNYASFTVGSAGTLMITPSNNKIILGSTRTPASASATGAAGEVCWDSDYIYVCTASNTWKRAALSTW